MHLKAALCRGAAARSQQCQEGCPAWAHPAGDAQQCSGELSTAEQSSVLFLNSSGFLSALV